MDKLELKHLAPYLPYGLGLWHEGWKDRLTMDIDGGTATTFAIQDVVECVGGTKPILRPLSDLLKDEEFETLYSGEIICGVCKITEFEGMIGIEVGGAENQLLVLAGEVSSECSYLFYQYMLEKHYDVFGLIAAGLAIDKNTLK